MKAETYVKRIVNNVKCSRSKKTEIKRQLLSDLSLRMENGETLERIIDSMGTPEEIAEEFNQNLSEEEQKTYRKGRRLKIAAIIAAVIAALFLFLAFCAWWFLPKAGAVGSSGNFTQEALEEKVENIILLLNQNDFETLCAESIEEIQPLLNREEIDKARKPIGDDWGEMQTIGKIYSQEMEQRGMLFIVTQVSVTYENVNVIYTITFDKDLKLAGIYMR